MDELDLRGKARQHPVTGILVLAGGLGLAGTFLGKEMFEDAAEKRG
ncbi:MAG TPA: hypothetical protein VJY65_13735 [Chloroflexota bacterium]|nr:hypothetical protein [Chloroflexota bacterium]